MCRDKGTIQDARLACVTESANSSSERKRAAFLWDKFWCGVVMECVCVEVLVMWSCNPDIQDQVGETLVVPRVLVP